MASLPSNLDRVMEVDFTEVICQRKSAIKMSLGALKPQSWRMKAVDKGIFLFLQ